MALHAIGGILKHAPAILAFAAPTTNSYRRLVPGFEAPVNLCLSARNRSAACRIPMYSPEPEGQAGRVPLPRPELQRVPDVLGHPDGRPGRHQEQDRPGQAAGPGHLRDDQGGTGQSTKKTPGSLEEAIDALKDDHEFLLEGGVFTEDLIEAWIDWKRGKGDRRDAPAAASARVPPVLRLLIRVNVCGVAGIRL